MQTNLTAYYKQLPAGQEAESILRACVHCGFCTATCPTYQQLHDERDGPRGRIYLIKQLLEGGEVTARTRTHLDRCLTCRSCETTCPSGVQYGRLVDIGRGLLEEALPRPATERAIRWGLRQVLPYPARFGALLKLGQWVRPLMPAVVRDKIPPANAKKPLPNPPLIRGGSLTPPCATATEVRLVSSPDKGRSGGVSSPHPRIMLALAGCAQPAAAPNTNAATARVLDRLGISLVEAPTAGCCGAVSYHLSAHAEGLDFMRRNIDAWWPALEAGAEALVMTASGCGAMVKEYGHLLRHDPAYADKAARVSERCKDISEILLAEDLSALKPKQWSGKTAFHCPCTLQHALKLNGVVEQVLQKVGISLAATKDKHLCCGSAGTYSILQPQLSQQLLSNKLTALTVDQPERIVTANIGCQLHLGSKAAIPVSHWIELLDNTE